MNDIEKTGYDYYPERIAQVVMEHDLIGPEQRTEFEKYLRGC